MLNVKTIVAEKRYEIDTVRLKVSIGSSRKNVKRIDLVYFPNNIRYFIHCHQNPYKDKFEFKIENNCLIVTRVDKTTGWDHHHYIDICFPSKSTFMFFQENEGPGSNWVTSFVSYKGEKILHSRDMDYYKNKGW